MPWTLSEGIVLEGQHKCFFFNCDSLHARLNSHYDTWIYQKKEAQKD